MLVVNRVVGQEDIAPLKLINLHADNVILKLLQSPNVQGPFSIVNALRPLEGNNENGDHMTVYIRFKPCLLERSGCYRCENSIYGLDILVYFYEDDL